MPAFECVVSSSGRSFETRLAIMSEGIKAEQGEGFYLLFADILDMRLINYRVRLFLHQGECQISQLGYQTETFFEQLWLAYAKKSTDALFVNDEALMCCEGDYRYSESDVQAHGIAKLEAYPECVCVHPHDAGSRRVPLCFVKDCRREGFLLNLTLDTGEWYEVSRLGRDTDGFFDRVGACCTKSRDKWRSAHRALERELDVRLGDARERYETLRKCASKVEVGLFGADDDDFWIVALAPGRAAVELVTQEDTATYLYQFATSQEEFVLRLRHAMEAVKKNRRVIFLEDEEIARIPLYRMAIQRSAHVRFLRSCNTGRLVHSKNWEDRVAAFLQQ